MKIAGRINLVTIILILASPFLIGCDSSEPDEAANDIATRIEIVLQESTTDQMLVSSIQGDSGFMAGATYSADTLRVEPGRSYVGHLRFFDANGDESTQTIWHEAENYQLFYTLAGVENLDLAIIDVESDYGPNEIGADLPVGLAFEINTVDGTFVELGTLRIIMGRYASNRKTGITQPEEPIADVEIPVRIEAFPEPPPDPQAPEEITKAVLTMARSDNSVVWTVTAVDPGGLAYDDYQVPDSLRIERCSDDGSGTIVCTDSDAVVWTSGLYTSTWDLSNADSGQNYSAEILTEGRQHQFFYRVNFGTSNITALDQDSAGLPIGMTFEIAVPNNVTGSGFFNVQLGHYSGETKTGSVGAQLKDLQIRIPFQVQ